MAGVQLQLVQPTWPGVLNEFHNVSCSFAETPARDVLKHLPEGVSASVLLLGCTDPSCLLTTLAARDPGLERLTAVLNAANPAQLARAILLLLMAAELDPESQDDMQLLWEVWYCAAWGPATLPRVKPFIERLQNSRVDWMTAVRLEDKEALKQVYNSWLAKDKLTFKAAMKARQELKESVESKPGDHAGCKVLLEGATQQLVKLGCFHDVQEALQAQLGQRQSGTHEGDLVQKVLQHDLETFFQTGHLAPNYSGQQAVRARTVNTTLLQPGANQWCFKVHCSPALCWGPFDADELVSAVKTGGQSGLMARVCIAHITQLVRNFQVNTQLGEQVAATVQGEGNSSRVQLQVQMVCIDPLQLCLHMPLSDTPQPGAPCSQQQGSRARSTAPVSSAPADAQQQTAQDATTPAAPAGTLPAPLLFDAIDSNLLADEVGPLPLLVAAKTRLKPVHHARLVVGLKAWATNNCTLAHYLSNMALCMPPSLTPTLLGLRLLTDLEADRPETAEEQDYAYRVDGFRELVWAPIPKELRTSLAPDTRLDGKQMGGPKGSIEACIQAVATQLCCVTHVTWAPGSHGLESGTPQLLACFLASLAERADMSPLYRGNGDCDSSGSNSEQGSSEAQCPVKDSHSSNDGSSSSSKDCGHPSNDGSSNSRDGGHPSNGLISPQCKATGSSCLEESGVNANCVDTAQHGSCDCAEGSEVLADTPYSDEDNNQLLARSRYVYMQKVLWALRTKVAKLLPQQFQLSFRTGIDILRSSLQQHAPESWQPADVPSCPGVKQLVVPLEPNLQCKHGCMRPVLVECNDGRHQQVRPAKIDSWAFKGTAVPSGVHIVDTWAPRPLPQTTHGIPAACKDTPVYLPADYAPCSEQAHICLAGTKLQLPVQQSMLQSPVQALGILAQLLLPSTCPSTGSYHTSSPQKQPGSTASSQHRTELRLYPVYLFESEHTYKVGFAIMDSDDNMVKDILSADPPPTCYHEIGGLQQFYESRDALEKLGDHSELTPGVCNCKRCKPSSAQHTLTIALKGLEDQVQPAELHMVWPVATGCDEPDNILCGSYSNNRGLEYDMMAGFLLLQLPKAETWELWPDDAAWGMLPKPLKLSSLATCTSKSSDTIHCCNMAQYSCKEEYAAAQSKSVKKPGTAQLTMLGELMSTKTTESDTDSHTDTETDNEKDTLARQPLQVLNGMSVDEWRKEARIQLSSMLGYLMHRMPLSRPLSSCNVTRLTVHERFVTRNGVQGATIVHLLLHPPILITKAGRPVLPVTVFDVSMCIEACIASDMNYEWFCDLLSRVGFKPGCFAPWNLSVSDGCLSLRRMLMRHALACEPTAAQQASLPDGQCIPYYYHSYLSLTQCLGSKPVPHMKPSKQTNSSTDGGGTQMSASSMYLKYRVAEVLTEINRCSSDCEKQELCSDLRQLLAQDGASSLPEELLMGAGIHLNWPPLQAAAANTPHCNCACCVSSSVVEQPDRASTPLCAPAAAVPACMQCGKQDGKLLKCGKCGAVQYCSRECQVAHWKQHKAVCRLSNE